jgi:hypothetical protein
MKGQQRLPFDEGENVGRRQPQLFEMPPDAAPGSNDQPQPSRIVPNTHPGQFQMFMTPREIRSKYQALDADREDVEPDRAGEMTRRPETTAGEPNIVANTALKERWGRWHGGASQVKDYPYARNEDWAEETDDQLYARKLQETQMDPSDYREHHRGGAFGSQSGPPDYDNPEGFMPSDIKPPAHPERGTGGRVPGTSTWDEYHEREDSYGDHVQSHYDRAYNEWDEQNNYGGATLYDKISAEGVQSPVHLSYNQMGQYGKPSVVGGHHRIAAQEDINPDQPIPVQHWADIWEAKSSPGYS